MTKSEKYVTLISQIKSIIEIESDFVANISNITSAIHFTFDFHWTGFYLNKENILILGPFQGPVACTRIPMGKGVCGKSLEIGKTLNVPDVHKFEGHIACSSLSNSEIVVPIFVSKKVVAILDIDSTSFNAFDNIDEKYLQMISELISKIFISISRD